MFRTGALGDSRILRENTCTPVWEVRERQLKLQADAANQPSEAPPIWEAHYARHQSRCYSATLFQVEGKYKNQLPFEPFLLKAMSPWNLAWASPDINMKGDKFHWKSQPKYVCAAHSMIYYVCFWRMTGWNNSKTLICCLNIKSGTQSH